MSQNVLKNRDEKQLSLQLSVKVWRCWDQLAKFQQDGNILRQITNDSNGKNKWWITWTKQVGLITYFKNYYKGKTSIKNKLDRKDIIPRFECSFICFSNLVEWGEIWK